MSARTRHPNILFIMSDQHAPDTIGAAGHPTVKTPVLDRLSARGVSFRNAYCAYPMCTPSRASFMSGLLTPAHGVWELGTPLGTDVVTWAHVLRRAGYSTSIAGRMHFVGPDIMHGFERRVYPEFRHHLVPSAYGDWDQPQGAERVMLGALRGAGPSDEPTEVERYDMGCVNAALRELSHLVSRGKDHPWALMVGLMLPHIPYQVSREYFDLYADADILVPHQPPNGKAFADNVPLQLENCRQWLGITDDGATPEEVRIARRAYYGMITHMDELIGRLVTRLEDLGVADDTWIVYASDHGDNMGEHGFWSKLNFYEQSVRVPLIVVPPGRPSGSAGKSCAATVSLIDWMSTMLDLTDQEPTFTQLPGRSLLTLLDDPIRSWGDRSIVSDYACGGTRVPMRMVRRGKWKAWFAPGFTPMLFNLENDPQEWHDRAGESASGAILDQLRSVSMADGYDAESLRETICMHKRRLTYIHKAQTGG